jgi:hypothetical protein
MPLVRCGPRERASGSMCRGGGGCEVCTGAEVGTAAGAAGAGGLTLKELSTKRIWLPEGAHSQLIPCCWHLPQVGWIRSHLICQYSGDTVIIIGHRRSKSLNACLYYLHTFLRLQTRQAETARGRGVAADMVNVGFELVVGIVVEEGLSLLFCGWLIRYRTL